MTKLAGFGLALAAFAAIGVVAWKQDGRTAHQKLEPTGGHIAAAYRAQQRVSEDGLIPVGALGRAVKQRKALEEATRIAGGGIAPASWTWLGPGNVGGRIRAILIDPRNPNVMYIGSVTGGIWKTTNGGTSWFPLDDFLPAISVCSMAFDRTNPDVILVGTGEGFFEALPGTSNTAFIRGDGIYRSTDAGKTFQQIAQTDTTDFEFVNRLAQSPTEANVWLAATLSGIWRSTDGGNTWANVRPGHIFDVKFHPTDGSKAIAGGHHLNAPVYSLDGGVTWQDATGAAGDRQELAYAPSDPNYVYAAVNASGATKVWRSIDGGRTYTLRTSGGGLSTLAAYTGMIWVDPVNRDRILVGGQGMARSTDGGVNLSNAFTNVHADHHIIVNHPLLDGTSNRTIFFGNDGGIYRSTDYNGTSSTELNNNLGITQFYGAVMNPISGVVLAGAQDNYTQRYSGNTEGWTVCFGGDGGFTATDHTDANYFYGQPYRALIFRSTNGGVSADYIYNGISDANSSTLVNFEPYILLDPNNPNRMLVGCRRLWRSNNVKAATPTWASIKAGLTFGPEERPDRIPTDHYNDNDPRNISTMAIAVGNSDIIWVGHNNGQIWKTTNGTATSPNWVRVDNGVLPGRWVSRIVIERGNPNNVTVAFLGYEPNNVWRTTDGGSTWTEITGTPPFKLPSAPCAALAQSPQNPNWLYVGTDVGLFSSSDLGQTWSAVTTGPGVVACDEITWRNDTTMILATHGRGVWMANVSQSEEPVSPASYLVRKGVRQAGNLHELIWSDDRRLDVQARAPFLVSDPSVQVEVSAQAPISSCSQLQFLVEGSTSATNTLARIELFDYQASAWVALDERAATQTDSVTSVLVTSNPSRFIESGPRTMKARVSIFDRGAPFLAWQGRTDQMLWRLTP